MRQTVENEGAKEHGGIKLETGVDANDDGTKMLRSGYPTCAMASLTGWKSGANGQTSLIRQSALETDQLVKPVVYIEAGVDVNATTFWMTMKSPAAT